jgi:GNAT superfamily N-acetyltransferase
MTHSSEHQGKWSITFGINDADAVDRILRLLPTWFGIEASNRAYVESARTLPTYFARPAGRAAPPTGAVADSDLPVGVLLVRRHFPEAAEIHLMAVAPELHRHGVGRALVQALEADLIADGCQLLQVKTLGPSDPDEGYKLTRRFYASMGFLPVEETFEIWDAQNPCLIMIKPLAQPAGSDGTAFARTTSP